MVLKGDPAGERVPENVEICIGDVTDMRSLKRFFDVEADCDITVIHCAAIVTVSPNYNQKVYDVNVQGTKNILKMCQYERDVQNLKCGYEYKRSHTDSAGFCSEDNGKVNRYQRKDYQKNWAHDQLRGVQFDSQ